MTSPFPLTSARYGKENIRVFRVVKTDHWHEVVEYTINVLLEGQIDASYTHADNSVVVATDSIKNTVNVFAKISPHVLTGELFTIHLGLHFLSEYKHINKVIIKLISHRWTRIPVDHQPHPHAFTRDGNDSFHVLLHLDRSNIHSSTISADLVTGFKDLLVLKSSGSSFQNFVRDKWTTLPEVTDRILSTSIDNECKMKIDLPSGDIEEAIKTLGNSGINYKSIRESIRKIILETFATDESASVQATLYRMCQVILDTHNQILNVSFSLPNKHYVPIDLSWYDNLQNTNVIDAEVFVPLDAPSGLITATVSRQLPSS